MAKKKTTRKAVKSTKTAVGPKPITSVAKDKPRSKGEVFTVIAESTGLSRKQVAMVFDSMSGMIKNDLGRGCGVFTVPGLMKIRRIVRPARPARKNVPNPFKPGELMDVPARKAKKVVKVAALKNLKGMV